MKRIYNEHEFNEISVVTKRFEKTVLHNIKPLVNNKILGANSFASKNSFIMKLENCKVQTTLMNFFSYSPA